MTTFPDVTAPAEAVTSARVDWAPVPRVNLLPAEIVEARRTRSLKRVLGGVVLGVAVACVGAGAWAQAGVSAAQQQVDAAQQRGTVLRAQQAKYADVPRVLGLIDDATTARQKAMERDVLWYGFLSDLALTTPKGITLQTLQVSFDAPGGAAATASTDPLTPTGIGHVEFTGQAARFPDVASWLEAVGTVHGLDGSTLKTATSGGTSVGGTPTGGTGGGVSFSSTVQVTTKALTHRYDRKAG